MAIVEVENLTFSYRSKSSQDIEIFKDVSIKIDKGKFIYLFAPNGSGKTTFIKLLINQLKATSGTIKYKLDNNNDESNLYNHISIISDYIKIPRFLTVEESIYQSFELCNKNSTCSNIENLLEEYNLQEHKCKQINQLSTGISKRVEILHNIIKDSEIMLLDEPTNGLDCQSIQEFMLLLKTIKSENKTIIYITHDFYNIDLDLLDEILLIKNKKIESFSKDIILEKYDGNILNMYKSFYSIV